MPADDALLVLNLGSTTLKAARYAGLGQFHAERMTPAARRIEIALEDSPGTPEPLLAQAVAALGFTGSPARVAHRIVHGGDAGEARILDAVEIDRLRALSALAPLHQPPALALVRGASALWPHAVQCGVFDTTWHASLPANTRRLPVPGRWNALGIRRYGFHGLAFASAMRLLRRLDPGRGAERVVFAHLGGGSSLCAVRNGQSLDTTMAMTPLDGLPMATRSGSLDPGALLYLLRHEDLAADALEQALYRECGLRGISGLSGDARELLASSRPDARLALDVFALRVAQGIAAMATALGGIEHLVFSGGIGANAASIRSAIVAYLGWLGMHLDATANARGDARLDAPGCPVRIWRVDVDEEGEIALACAAIAAPREG